MARKARGDRFRAYVDNEIVYWTDSVKGMRDQCVRLLEYKYRNDTIIVSDTLDNSFVKRVSADSPWNWGIWSCSVHID